MLLLVLSAFLLCLSSSQAIVSAYTSYYAVQPKDLECYKAAGIKKLIFKEYNLDYNFLKKQLAAANAMEFSEKHDIVINVRRETANNFFFNFGNYFSDIPYDMVWLRAGSSIADCETLSTLVYECGRKGLNCGVSMSDFEWDQYIAKGNRTSCDTMGNVPLFYRGNAKNWKQMGGWTKFNFNEGEEKVEKCYSQDISIYRVDKR